MGWKDIHPVISKAVFEDGTVIELPSIEVGDAGHVYRPEGFPDMVKKSRTTFGRGSEGQSIARRTVGRAFKDKLQVAQARSKLITVDTAIKGETYFSNTGPSFIVHVYHRQLGAWSSVAAWRESGYSYRRDSGKVVYRIGRPAWADGFRNMEVESLYLARQGRVDATLWQDCGDISEANEQLLRFREDPFGVIEQRFADFEKNGHQENFGPVKTAEARTALEFLRTNTAIKKARRRTIAPEDWRQHTQCEDYAEEGLEVAFTYDRAAEYLTPQALGRVLRRQILPLEELGRAIAVTGARFNLSYTNHYPLDDQVLDNLEIYVPASKLMNQAHPHQITFSNRGIAVECGYLKDEEKALEYEKRQIRNALLEIPTEDEGPEWEETIYDIGKGA